MLLGPRVQDLGFFYILFGPGALGFRVLGARALGFFYILFGPGALGFRVFGTRALGFFLYSFWAWGFRV